MSALAGNVVILGAGQTGYWVARTLRDRGFPGEIILIGDELHPPYERPPLSKDVMRGLKSPTTTYLATFEQLAELDVTAMLGVAVIEIDRTAKTVIFEDASTLRYDTLVIATGGRCRSIVFPEADDAKLHYLRTIEDSISLYAVLARGTPLLVIGGGWIGLEAAAAARMAGVAVTLVEAAPQLCMRVLPPGPADSLLQLHRGRGVDVRLGCVVERLAGGNATLSTGEKVSYGALILGVGMIPNVELAIAAGLAVDNGILVDNAMRTSDPAIFAAGDVARYRSARLGRTMRLESWSNAQDGGIAVARSIIGDGAAYDPLPWFWSDQYDVNLQVLGIPEPHHDVIERGDVTSGAYSLIYLSDGAIAAVISINQARDNRILRKMMEAGKSLDRRDLADTTVNLQQALRTVSTSACSVQSFSN
jgi:3-phenylpropionate/trans-cinnamate dioxygenase ferredoxin reductase component